MLNILNSFINDTLKKRPHIFITKIYISNYFVEKVIAYLIKVFILILCQVCLFCTKFTVYLSKTVVLYIPTTEYFVFSVVRTWILKHGWFIIKVSNLYKVGVQTVSK